MDRYFIPFSGTASPLRIYDRLVGCGGDGGMKAVAIVPDIDMAHRICALLNADGLKPEKGTAK